MRPANSKHIQCRGGTMGPWDLFLTSAV